MNDLKFYNDHRNCRDSDVSSSVVVHNSLLLVLTTKIEPLCHPGRAEACGDFAARNCDSAIVVSYRDR